MNTGNKVVLSALLSTLLVSGASARQQTPACPENAIGHVSAVRALFEKKDEPVNQQAVDNANILAIICESQFITMYQLADAWYQLLFRDDLSLDQQGTVANRAVGLLMKADHLPPVAHNYEVSASMRDKLMRAAIKYAEAGGPGDPYFSEGGRFDACKMSWSNVVQTLWYEHKNSWTSKTIPVFIENASKSCTETTSFYGHIYFAQMRTQEALRETDPVQALTLINDARDTYMMYANGRAKAYEWEASDQARFFGQYDKIAMNAAAASAPLPRSDWFTPDNLGSGASRLAIALAANNAWGEHHGIVENVSTGAQYRAQMEAYRAFVTEVFSDANAAGPEAVTVLRDALENHAKGQLRTDKTAGYKSPPDFMWNWIKPDNTGQ